MSYLPADARLVCLAREIATKAHAGQERKLGPEKGMPYIEHPRRVAEQFPQAAGLACVGWLHDVIEDTRDKDKPWTAHDLRVAGIPQCVVDAVEVLTHAPDENYCDYILRIRRHTIARVVKLKDLADNMASLDEGSLKDKYRLAHWILSNVGR